MNYAASHGNEETMQKYNLDRRRLKEWQNKKEKIESMKFKRNTFKVKSTKDFARYPDMERELQKWIVDKRSKGCCVSGFAIKQQASAIYRNRCPAATARWDRASRRG